MTLLWQTCDCHKGGFALILMFKDLIRPVMQINNINFESIQKKKLRFIALAEQVRDSSSADQGVMNPPCSLNRSLDGCYLWGSRERIGKVPDTCIAQESAIPPRGGNFLAKGGYGNSQAQESIYRIHITMPILMIKPRRNDTPH
jgi:hypothetical protein